ncbi:dTDP-4-dehydrorhamnose reductase [Gordonia sp. (in: high G+C Gram-positive bacteria)]|uniref:dTDP-4-dehydrorhamnose reductase n=1 Tax=Gordonia sp. (in: high G+C Gram-positive bacteria) TaxID=84139 RepID=UPI00169A934A|nr:dTDP-4-dehydrorhamnose reductase [Gordonia sp. (in: high G+C Gram-positive bacteria)]NLG45882.1 dTDP-4-dehydrorhamnose reductase [Gordonia sp. (in: high G+C Gram-positive bacteria)]
MSDRRFYVIGAAGQLGNHLIETADGRPVTALTSADIDLTDESSVWSALAEVRRGDVIVNAAAYTAVDAAESDARTAFAVNADGPRSLAVVANERGARLIHVSTDYVFAQPVRDVAGEPRPYEPTDPTGSPATVYGASKLAGELSVRDADPSVIVVRTSWVFTGRRGSADFVATMARLEAERETLQVVDDQVGSPTYARDLALGLWELADAVDGPSLRDGALLHACNAGSTTWNGLARAVFAELGSDPERVQPCTTDQFPRPAPRPGYSVLSSESWAAAGLTPLRSWRDALHAAMTARSGDDHPLR